MNETKIKQLLNSEDTGMQELGLILAKKQLGWSFSYVVRFMLNNSIGWNILGDGTEDSIIVSKNILGVYVECFHCDWENQSPYTAFQLLNDKGKSYIYQEIFFYHKVHNHHRASKIYEKLTTLIKKIRARNQS